MRHAGIAITLALSALAHAATPGASPGHSQGARPPATAARPALKRLVPTRPDSLVTIHETELAPHDGLAATRYRIYGASPARPRAVDALPKALRDAVSSFSAGVGRMSSMPTQPDRLAVFIPARGEEKQIESTLERLLARIGESSYEQTDIHVVLNGPRDRTRELVEAFARRRLDSPGGPSVRILVDESAPGKVNALRTIDALFAGGRPLPEHVLQLDADTRLGAGDLERLKQIANQNPEVGAVAPRPRYVADDGKHSSGFVDLVNSSDTGMLTGPVILFKPQVARALYKTISES